MKLIIVLGFDEKFAIRSVIRNSLQERDEIYAVTPESGDIRAEKAFSSLKDFVYKAFNNVKVECFHVPVNDFPLAMNSLRIFLRGMGVGKKILNLSGGQRILVVALLMAASSLDIDVEIEIETEDSKYVHRFPISLMRGQNLDPIDLKLIGLLSKDKLTVGSLSELLEISRPTVWRRLGRLAELKLVEKMEKGEYRLSDAGRSLIG